MLGDRDAYIRKALGLGPFDPIPAALTQPTRQPGFLAGGLSGIGQGIGAYLQQPGKRTLPGAIAAALTGASNAVAQTAQQRQGFDQQELQRLMAAGQLVKQGEKEVKAENMAAAAKAAISDPRWPEETRKMMETLHAVGGDAAVADMLSKVAAEQLKPPGTEVVEDGNERWLINSQTGAKINKVGSVYRAPVAAPETWTDLGDGRQRSSRGEIKAIPSNVEEGKTLDERDAATLFNWQKKVAAGTATQDDINAANAAYNRMAQPKTVVDAATGQLVLSTPDMRGFPVPPAFAQGGGAAPPPAAGGPPVLPMGAGGGPLAAPAGGPSGAPGGAPGGAAPPSPVDLAMDPLKGIGQGSPAGQPAAPAAAGPGILAGPLPAAQPPAAGGPATPPQSVGPAAPPAQPPVQMGGPATVAPQPGIVPRDNVQRYQSARSSGNDLLATTQRMREIIKENGGIPRPGSAGAAQLEYQAQRAATALGGLSNSGVMQPSELELYKGLVGNPTSLLTYGADAIGMSNYGARLDEMDADIKRKIARAAKDAGHPVVTSEEDYKALKPGTEYFDADGNTYRKK